MLFRSHYMLYFTNLAEYLDIQIDQLILLVLVEVTEVDINPFGWFTSEIEFYPNVVSVKGLIDLWFQKWQYTKHKPNPFLSVIYINNGPYMDKAGCELYQMILVR